MFRRRLIEIPIFLLFLLSAMGVIIYSISPDPKTLAECQTTKMNSVDLCSKSEEYVPLSEVNSNLVNAILVSEDINFYHHKGFDLHEMYHSFLLNLKKGRFVRGGSTITQQLVKNVFLSPEKSILRKVREAYLAYQIEGLFSKDVIIEKYLNVVELGPEIFGVKAASWFYFNKKPSELSPLESVYMAQLLPNPKKYSQTFSDEALDERTKKAILLILLRMHQYKRITSEQYKHAQENIDHFPWQGI